MNELELASDFDFMHIQKEINSSILERLMLKDSEENKAAVLSCGHKISKDFVIHHALREFILKRQYRYCCWCIMCNKIIQLTSFKLECGCVWSNFHNKIEVTDEFNYGKCKEHKQLSVIDLCLINDYISFKFTSLECLEGKVAWDIMDLFYERIGYESIKDILWIALVV
eukprot:TRINITY_DN10077_c0_g4_i2.p1 TRINITY_DN10077_c0_g4~~TRINITY_DN10077_c0_g4_i2.p1  ORF type:complete len:169 (+),score=10.00 TRINITY_DN10077_c0_g4_i2:55-561(+)